MTENNIHWPVLLQYQGDPELLVITSHTEWLAEYASHHFTTDDRLIDSSGRCFALQQRRAGQVLPEATASNLSLDAINNLLRVHFSAAGHCCVTKMLVTSVSQAVAAVAASE